MKSLEKIGFSEILGECSTYIHIYIRLVCLQFRFLELHDLLVQFVNKFSVLIMETPLFSQQTLCVGATCFVNKFVIFFRYNLLPKKCNLKRKW